MENRSLLAQVTWVGLAGTTHFHHAANWDTNTVPGPEDDVLIPDMPGDLLLNTGDIQLRSIDSAERLSGTRLELTAPSIFHAPLRNLAVIATGPDAALSVQAIDTTKEISFLARAGGRIQIDQPGPPFSAECLRLIATGAGSRITVPNLEIITQVQISDGIHIEATGGGVVDLPSLRSVELGPALDPPIGASFTLTISGTNSRLIAPNFHGCRTDASLYNMNWIDWSRVDLTISDGGTLEANEVWFVGNIYANFDGGVATGDFSVQPGYFDNPANPDQPFYFQPTFTRVSGVIGGTFRTPQDGWVPVNGTSSKLLRVGRLEIPSNSSLRFSIEGDEPGTENSFVEVAGHASIEGRVYPEGAGLNSLASHDRIVLMTHASATGSPWVRSLNGNPALIRSSPTETSIEVLDDIVQFTPAPLVVSEQGPSTSLEISLKYPIWSNQNAILTLNISPSDEAALTPSQLVFTHENWNIPQTVRIKGLEDDQIDGDQPFSIHVAGWAAGASGLDVNGVCLDSGNTALPAGMRVDLYSGSRLYLDFPEDMDPSVLNLYDNQAGLLGPPDIVVIGDRTGPVRGSLHPNTYYDNQSTNRFTFFPSISHLPEDTYTIRIRGAVNGFRNLAGVPFDGDGDGTPGGDLVRRLYLAPWDQSLIEITLDPLVAGPGQMLGPAGQPGIPLTLKNPGGLTRLEFYLYPNTEAVQFLDVIPSPALPPGWTLNYDPNEPFYFDLTGPDPLPPVASLLIGWMQARVSEDAPYGSKYWLMSTPSSALPVSLLNNLSSREYPLIVAYPGDLNANGAVTASDVVQLRRLITGIDPGLAAFPTLDPIILADFNRSGTATPADVTLLRRFIVGLPQTSIPPIPGGIIINQSGIDPKISIPRNLKARRGEIIEVPVWFQHTGAVPIDLRSLDLAIQFDPRAFTFLSAAPASLAPADEWLVSAVPSSGRLAISAAAVDPIILQPGVAGPIALLRFQVNDIAPLGRSTLNLLNSLPADGRGIRTTVLNDGQLTLLPSPTNRADDPVDGVILISRQPRALVRLRSREQTPAPRDSVPDLPPEPPALRRTAALRSLARLRRPRA